MARTTRWLSSSGSSPAPAPVTVTRQPAAVTRALTSSYSASARPSESKPGPRFALVAGTRTRTGSETKDNPIRSC